MPRLVPGIHAFSMYAAPIDVDGRDTPGHDTFGVTNERYRHHTIVRRPIRRLTASHGFALIAAMTHAANYYYWFISSHTGGAQGFV